ncbi:ArsR/SmtB family transcription factor [Paucibacter soli]|uniref:ArsR/SmtB family transcription factor n=1 Tax=Paucibacter soli TaxID=3133433 RepID=UPI0030ADC767
MRELKNQLYEQVARLGKAVASPKRLELIELLCQGEKTVETLAAQADISVKLASAHLKELRQARLVDTSRDGKYVVYRLASTSVADLWVHLRTLAQERLAELQLALSGIVEHQDALHGMNEATLLKKAAAGEVLILDVRPQQEYDVAHLPHARSMPVGELKKRLADLPKGLPIVAYCRGPFCLMARDAVALLRKKGRQALHLSEGVAEWRARGLPVETSI